MAGLRAREIVLIGFVENIDHTTDPEWLALRTIELVALRRILALFPQAETVAPLPPPETPVAAQRRERLEHLRAVVTSARAEAAHIRAHQVPGVDLKLRAPYDTSKFKPPLITGYMSSEEAWRAGRQYDVQKAAYFSRLEAQRENLIARAAELQQEADRAEEELARLEGEA